jgi:predicted phage baseplate assembly protein
MALEPVQLDTLTWDQMVTAIRTRIVPDSQGKWTLHAPVDPGVTMLELYAWELEQRIYWMNQVPAALNLAVLSLLGTDQAPAQAATTVMQIEDAAIPPRSFPVAAAGMLMQLGDTNPPVLFTVSDSITVLPVEEITVSVNGVDKSNDLQQGRPVPLLELAATAGEVDIVLVLSSVLPAAAAGQFFSLMIELETTGAVFPQWTANAVPVASVPAPSTLTWSYTNTANASASFAQVDDETVGLRRSGVVRLALPADWQPEAQGVLPGGTAYKITLQIENASFSYPPCLSGIEANVALARHVWSRAKNAGTGPWPPLPGNLISLPTAPSASSIRESPPIEDSVQVQINEPDGTNHPWQRVTGLSFAGPTDRVFVVNRATATVSFGDGLTGRLPLTASGTTADIAITYNAGGGSAGNVNEGLFWEAVAATDGGASPEFTGVNLSAGDGGAETETLEAALARAGAALNERNRAVSQADYEELAQTTPGVGLARAYAEIGYHPDFPCSTVPGAVTVFVVPYAPRAQNDGDWASEVFVAAPVPDQGALQAAQARLCKAKLIGGEVFVIAPVYRAVWLTVTIAVDAPLSQSVRQGIISALQTFLDPLVGGDAGEGWPFGDPVRPSALLRVAQAQVGTLGDVQSVAVRIDAASAAGQACKDVPIRAHELVNLKHVDLVTQRRAAMSGGLR